ncbi:MAG: hypothetical protein AMXMBFR84_49080 [Candidatus Hydrogenedentota bacterium]
MSGMVTLTTDFGMRDPYVAALKGVIQGISPRLMIVDLTHEIAPQDVLEASLFLVGATPYFPKETVHCVVIDPGVGTGRLPLAVKLERHVVVCPDNGLLSLLIRFNPLVEARVIQNPKLMRETISATFHGRDIFAPVAAYLAAGTPFEDVGDVVDTIQLLSIPEPQQCTDGTVSGQVIHIDRFGNAITNIHRRFCRGDAIKRLSAGEVRLEAICRTYADVEQGAALALFGSSDHLEIAVNHGRSDERLSLKRGDTVVLEW